MRFDLVLVARIGVNRIPVAVRIDRLVGRRLGAHALNRLSGVALRVLRGRIQVLILWLHGVILSPPARADHERPDSRRGNVPPQPHAPATITGWMGTEARARATRDCATRAH